LTAAFVPVAAALSATDWVTGALGGLILVLEGLQQLGRYHDTWISYRGTCERLTIRLPSGLKAAELDTLPT
jgi:Protein of unknown function (DUF4231)